ncbi:MAG: adenylate/guanylate cyclase domain-containing protein [Thermodesulfobacteriota bacterium]
MSRPMPESRRPQEIRFGPPVRLSLMANLLGLFIIVSLNFVTPLEIIKVQRSFILEQGGWILVGLLWPVALVLALLVQWLLLRPLTDLRPGRPDGREGTATPGTERAMRRVLNLPALTALGNLLVWIVTPSLVSVYFYFFRDVKGSFCLFIFFRAAMIGLIASGLSFFFLERHLRETWIPLLFPGGRLGSVPGTVKIPVLRRIRVLYGAGTLNPMIILVSTLLFAYWEMGGSTVPTRETVTDIVFFTLILCIVFVLVALGLNVLAAKSILGPVGKIMKVIPAVKQGDFSQRIQVVSNDEIGILGDAANDMIRGLAERERIRETFGRYVTPEIRDRILSGLIPLDGERRVATVLFSDLRDFTPYVEENPPEEVIKGIRAYFTAMQRAIRQHGGLVLQYVGDEIEAAFGVPIPSESHADDALLAALSMRKVLAELDASRERSGRPPFRHGIGIHTGMVLAGNTGSDDHLSYALIGDTVNLGSRIQGLTKAFHQDILLSEDTVKSLRGSYELRKEAPATVKGYSKPVTVYSVIQ